MKYIVFTLALLLSGASFAQDDVDPSVLKSQIKELEKVIKTQDKDVVKIEKKLAKIRPEAEQAKRDAENIKEMRVRIKEEFEAFEYDKKEAELKATKKELKGVSKNLSKATSKKEKLKSQINEIEREAELLANSRNTKQNQISEAKGKLEAIPAEEKEQLRVALKSKTPNETAVAERATLLQSNEMIVADAGKELKGLEKNYSKLDSKKKSLDNKKQNYVDQETQLTATKAEMTAKAEALEQKLETMNPKAIEKELIQLEKDENTAQIRYEELNTQLVQNQAIIDELHDMMEGQKQMVRDKQSALDKK